MKKLELLLFILSHGYSVLMVLTLKCLQMSACKSNSKLTDHTRTGTGRMWLPAWILQSEASKCWLLCAKICSVSPPCLENESPQRECRAALNRFRWFQTHWLVPGAIKRSILAVNITECLLCSRLPTMC